MNVGSVTLGGIIQTRSLCSPLQQNPRRGQQEVDSWEYEGVSNGARGTTRCHICSAEVAATGHVIMPTFSPAVCCESEQPVVFPNNPLRKIQQIKVTTTKERPLFQSCLRPVHCPGGCGVTPKFNELYPVHNKGQFALSSGVTGQDFLIKISLQLNISQDHRGLT